MKNIEQTNSLKHIKRLSVYASVGLCISGLVSQTAMACDKSHKVRPAFSELDLNANGAVSLEEFKTHRKERRQARRERCGDKHDKNSDNTAHGSEHAKANKTTDMNKQAHRAHKMETIFNRIDTDQDGVVSEQEFLAHKPRKHHRNEG